MVANLTLGSKKLSDRWDEVRPVALQGQALKDWFLSAVDEDTAAFNAVMDAMRLPKKTEDETAARTAAVQAATRRATEVPFSVLERSREVLDLAETVVRSGNPSSVSDAGVAAICVRACAEGAFLNVGINLAGISDRSWVDQTAARSRELLDQVRRRAETVIKEAEARATAG
jgi:glutamate formiminotransferase/formiminotetrahydrofolate cyclodeaminase